MPGYNSITMREIIFVAREAVKCHFDNEKTPGLIKLRIVKEEIIAL